MSVQTTTEELELSAGQTGQTGWFRFERGCVVQVTGAATKVRYRVERSTRGPRDERGLNVKAIDTVDAAAGAIETAIYDDLVSVWWRVDVQEVTGGAAVFALSGEDA